MAMSTRRRAAVAALVAALVAVPAGVLWWAADDAATTAARAEPTATTTATTSTPASSAATTPVLSARRVPGVVSGHLVTASLVAGVRAVGAAAPAPSCLTVAVDGAPVYDQRGTKPVMPASNQKLITATVALDVLGPDTRLSTRVLAPAGQKGVIRGDLVLVGGGDPLLATADYVQWIAKTGGEPLDPHTPFEALADAVKAAGVTKVVGSVVGDDGRYDRARKVASWPAAYQASLQVGPLGALVVNDGFQSLAPRRLAPDPAQQAATIFTRLLAARGVDVEGPPRAGATPPRFTDVARIDSPPLRDMARELLTSSDNLTGELLLKEIGLRVNSQGTTAAGAAAVTARLRAWGLLTPGEVVIDGSGLDRGNRTTCRALVGVLARGGATLRRALAVAGETGTLRVEFTKSPMKGRLLGKTGTLTGAKSLSGVVPSGGHEISFAFVYNGPRAAARAVPLWVRLANAFASFPDHPDLRPFGPRSMAAS